MKRSAFMGEYATFNDYQIKIGTCEDMYYLRFDQRALVRAERGSVDPVADAEHLRFRFPWPDEDGIEPGSGKFYDNGFHRSLPVHGFAAPSDVDHGTVQFVAQAGYNVSLPCPESDAYTGGDDLSSRLLTGGGLLRVRVHRNGFSGAVHLVAQRLIPGVGLVPILKCGGCETMWREEERARIEELAVCLRAEGDRYSSDARRWHIIADRVLHGLTHVEHA